ncbi:MAG: hypothetical protein NWF07_00835 [Candidatus Bathyarchaeota archaeon]|nr:hypothetical protein [Candidatus Bathyarchaeota archaeon]
MPTMPYVNSFDTLNRGNFVAFSRKRTRRAVLSKPKVDTEITSWDYLDSADFQVQSGSVCQEKGPKPRKVKVRNPDLASAPAEPVFEGRVFEGVALGSSLRNMLWSEVAAVIGSFLSIENLTHGTPQAAQKHRELTRDAAAIGMWTEDEDAKQRARRFLCAILGDHDYMGCVVKQSEKLFDHHVYESSPIIYMPSPPDSMFEPEVKSKKVKPPRLSRVGETNFVYDLLKEANVCSKRLTLQKLKCLIRGMRMDGKSFNDVRDVLETRMFLLRGRNAVSIEHARRMSWAAPYIHSELTNITPM